MEDFRKALDESVKTWAKLSEEWEKIESNKSDYLSHGYPFDKDFREILHDLIEWREKVKTNLP
ncbi:hypothetical protein [Ammoniphilus sp. CFH 90114]|uniref:hypothetical protein n=1 Tax=Ammoniphilus sp. CFH 90114 TaxID=2493665 RepID=UPI00100EB176|nr:hypothetical protein [Ammoniphilus sp. CFH 90114]RXT08863.1 hypothetical protein EIZ39_08665 [Ammoniphilus sp. CFH 90114]